MRFEGKVLFATGGGSGLAAASARRYAAEGGRVAVVDLDRARAEAVAAELDGAVAIACDVADEDSVRSAVATAVDRLGRIDSVFNAAGHVVFGPFETYPLADGTGRSPSTPTGTFLVCQNALPALRAGGWGRDRQRRLGGGARGRSQLGAYSRRRPRSWVHAPARRRPRARQHPGQRRRAGLGSDRDDRAGLDAHAAAATSRKARRSPARRRS